MPIISDQAIVLSRLDYSETSQVMVLFTREHGKVRAIAKGIKRGTKTRFAAGIDLLDIGNVMLSSRQERSANLATVTEWKQQRSLPGLREKLFRIHAGQYAAEITSVLTEDWDPHVELFDALMILLTQLSEQGEELVSIVVYQRSLLHSIGSHPRFDVCITCGRLDDLTHFSSFEGGMICKHCEPQQVEKREVSKIIYKAIQTMDVYDAELNENNSKMNQISDESILIGVFDILDYHIAHLMGKQPRLADKLVPQSMRRKLRTE